MFDMQCKTYDKFIFLFTSAGSENVGRENAPVTAEKNKKNFKKSYQLNMKLGYVFSIFIFLEFNLT